jgi:hypothetical protein
MSRGSGCAWEVAVERGAEEHCRERRAVTITLGSSGYELNQTEVKAY